MTENILDELNQAGIDAMVACINIPPQPALLMELQAEIRKEDLDPRKIVQITSRDVALSAAVLKVVNSPFFGLNRQADSLEQATMMLGTRPLSTLVSGMLARQAVDVTGPPMTRFWDTSYKRAVTLQFLARKLRLVEPDVAQTFGLFCDLGIPLLMRKFPAYIETLGHANSSLEHTFTEVEQATHNTDHALIGAIMAKTWGLSPLLSTAIRVHHGYEYLGTNNVPDPVQDLVAMGLLAEKIIQMYAGQNRTVEWERGGDAALKQLSLSEHGVEDFTEDVHSLFDKG